MVRCDREPRQRYALIKAKARFPAPRRSHPAVSAASCRTRRAFTVAQHARKGDLRPQPPESGECRIKDHFALVGSDIDKAPASALVVQLGYDTLNPIIWEFQIN